MGSRAELYAWVVDYERREARRAPSKDEKATHEEWARRFTIVRDEARCGDEDDFEGSDPDRATPEPGERRDSSDRGP